MGKNLAEMALGRSLTLNSSLREGIAPVEMKPDFGWVAKQGKSLNDKSLAGVSVGRWSIIRNLVFMPLAEDHYAGSNL